MKFHISSETIKEIRNKTHQNRYYDRNRHYLIWGQEIMSLELLATKLLNLNVIVLRSFT